MRRSTAILQLALIVLLLAVRVHGAQAEPLGYISAEIRFGIDRIYRSDPAIGYFTALPLIVSHGERVGNFSSDDYLDALLFAIVDEDGSLGSASRIGAASGSGPFGPSSHVSSGAGIMIDDVVISSTTPGIFYAPLSLNLDIHGSLRTNTIRGEATSGVGVAGSVQQPQCCGLPELGGGFQAHINILSEVRVFEPSATTRVRRSGLFAADSDFEETISLGSSAEIEINQRLTSPSYRLRLNTPFKVLLQLSTGVETIQAENSVTYVSSADADFAHSLRFPGDGPVFNLPLDVTANSRDGRIVDNRFVGVSPPPPADTTAPTTSAAISPAANAAGWNNTDVAVTLTAADDAGGSGVKEIQYSLSGAQGGGGTVHGAAASLPISAEGTTVVTYFARDNAGNTETAKVLTVRIDKTPPLVACPTPPPAFVVAQSGAVVSASVSDGGSGALASPVSAAADTSSAGTFAVSLIGVDIAGNRASQSCGYMVAKASQTITFDPLPGHTEGDPPFTVSATASSGLPVSFSIVSGPATITGTSITLLDSGTVMIRASQAGNASYNPAPSVDRLLVVAAGPAGRMHGHGEVDETSMRHRFSFFVWQARTGQEGGQLEYHVSLRGSGKGTDRFESTAVRAVTFSQSPSHTSDSVAFSGVGRWNGHAGYTFEARATDGGRRERGDMFSLTIRAADGSVVAAVTGPLSGGNIVSLRVPHGQR